MTETNPAKRIPKSLGTETQLLGRFTLTDLLVAGLPAVGVVLLTQVLLPGSWGVAGITVDLLTIPLAILALGGGAALVAMAPAHTSSLDWLLAFLAFHRRTPHLTADEATTHTHVAECWPAEDALIRDDGAVVGAIQVDPPSMALATDDDWERTARAFEDVVNTTVTFPIQIYSTTRPFSAAEFLQPYRERLAALDGDERPALQSLIESYIEWYRDDIERREMSIRDHYVIVAVRPREIRFEREGVADRLAQLPGIGHLARALTAPPRARERAALAAELDERCHRLEQALRTIDGVDTSRVEGADVASLVAEYWAAPGDADRIGERLRSSPVVA